MSDQDNGWWTDFFDDFRPVFGLIDKKTTNAQVKYLFKKLNLKSGKSFLDCPCGIGRVSIPLAKMGIRVTGVDITKSYLDELNGKARRGKLNIQTIQSDMRRINFNSRFDAGGNLWTSFGFFATESDNFLALKKMFLALKPGGRFVLHLTNRDWIMANFQPHDWSSLSENIKMAQERRMDFRTSILFSVWHLIKDGKERSFDVNIRSYSYHELVAMFEKAGFIDIEGYGSLKDEPISLQSRMMWVFGTRPKR